MIHYYCADIFLLSSGHALLKTQLKGLHASQRPFKAICHRDHCPLVPVPG